MHDQPRSAKAPEELAQAEAAVMAVLLHGGHGWPWSRAEIARELGDEIRALTAVAALHGAGGVHCFGEFVFPCRAATRMEVVRSIFG